MKTYFKNLEKEWVDLMSATINSRPLSGEETLVESPFVLEYTFVKERTYSLENAILEIALIDDRSLGIADRSIAGPAHRDGMGRST